MSTSPLVTILVLTYNRESLLKKCIESILAQTYNNFEVIIGDNCSTDGTEELCIAYVEKDSRIKYHRHSKNFGGQYNARYLYTLDHGKYVYSVNDDDYISSNVIEDSVKLLENDPKCSVAYGTVVMYDEKGNVLLNNCPEDIAKETFEERLQDFCKTIRTTPIVTGLIRSENLKVVGGYGTSFAEDQTFMLKQLFLGSMRFLPEAIYYKTTTESTTRTLENARKEYNIPEDMTSHNYYRKIIEEYIHSIVSDPFYKSRIKEEELPSIIYALVETMITLPKHQKKRSKLGKIMRILKGKEI